MGPRIRGKKRGENAGKGHGPAGTCDNLHRPPDGGTTEGGGRVVVWAHEPVGAKTGGSCYPKDQAWSSWEVTPQQDEGALGHDGQRQAPPQDAEPESGGQRQRSDEWCGTPCGEGCR